MLTHEKIEAIRKRAEMATDGPWFSEEVGKMSRAKWYGVYTDDDDIGVDTTYQADAIFIAHARTDIPKLLAEVDRLKTELAASESHGEYLWDKVDSFKREIKMLESAVSEDDSIKERYSSEIERLQEESDKLEELMQEIDTHLRSTPEPLPYIFETMRKYWNYREVTNR